MMKKNVSTSIVSLSRGIAESNADTRILNPSIPEIVRNGLSTLNTLITFRFMLPLAITSGKYALTIITKSSMFHESLKYEPFGMMNPSPKILNNISIV